MLKKIVRKLFKEKKSSYLYSIRDGEVLKEKMQLLQVVVVV